MIPHADFKDLLCAAC